MIFDVCVKVSTHGTAFIVVPLGIHSTITGPEMSKKSVNITFLTDVFDLVFVVCGEFLRFHVNEDCLLVHLWYWRHDSSSVVCGWEMCFLLFASGDTQHIVRQSVYVVFSEYIFLDIKVFL